jgi:hypothetical protein
VCGKYTPINRVSDEPEEYCSGQEVNYKAYSTDVLYFDEVSINMIYSFQAVFCLPYSTHRWLRTPHNRST